MNSPPPPCFAASGKRGVLTVPQSLLRIAESIVAPPDVLREPRGRLTIMVNSRGSIFHCSWSSGKKSGGFAARVCAFRRHTQGKRDRRSADVLALRRRCDLRAFPAQARSAQATSLPEEDRPFPCEPAIATALRCTSRDQYIRTASTATTDRAPAQARFRT